MPGSRDMTDASDTAWDQGPPPKVLVYCHDSVGIGHIRRSLNICERLGRHYPEASFLLATGTPYVQLLNRVPRLDTIKLPALTKVENGLYRSKYLALPTDRLMHCRENMLLQVAQDFEPDILLVDKAPLGVCRELVPTLRWLRDNRPMTRIIFGMRDIEDDATATIDLWDRDGVPEILESCFDEIWVYGMREVFDVAAEYRLSAGVRRKLHFMGYVCPSPCDHPPALRSSPRKIVVTVGGGTDGENVLDAYLAHAARRLATLGIASTLIGGPDLPAAAAGRLRAESAAIPGVEWLEFEPCMSCQFRAADLVVSMGGYNTMCELAGHGRPAVIIPRTRPRREQAIRARLWESRCPLRTLLPEELTPQRLTQTVESMLCNSKQRGAPALDLGGLDQVVQRFGCIWFTETRCAPALPV